MKVYCEECKWYVLLEECSFNKCKIEKWSNGSAIRRPQKIIDPVYADCNIVNRHNDCRNFQWKDAETEQRVYDCYD